MTEFSTSLASLLCVPAFCRSLPRMVFPLELRFASLKFPNQVLNCFSSYCYYHITKIDGVDTIKLLNAVQLYLSSFIPSSRLSKDDCINDIFDGLAVQWEHVVMQRQSQSFSWRPLPDEKGSFRLQIRKRDKDLILNSYLDYIMDKANDIRRKNQQRLLYTNSRGGSLDSPGQFWDSVSFKHPRAFDTLAMDPERKRDIMKDLRNFASREVFYQQTSRARKRRYLLYGLPRTGKSSMIAPMANFLGYNIYNLELTEVHSNSELQNLLLKTSSKSIIVIKHINCSVDLSNQSKVPQATVPQSYYDPRVLDAAHGGEDGNNNTITFWGLLNLSNELWSCCGSERIFVYTTNHFKKLDPALLESSRMDMHICMSQL